MQALPYTKLETYGGNFAFCFIDEAAMTSFMLYHLRLLTLTLILFLVGLSLQSASAAEPTEIPIWPGAAPGSENLDEPELSVDRGAGKGYVDRSISHVHRPTLTVHLPEATKPTAAMIICPGGGLTRVVIDKEGNDLAKLLNKWGVAGIVLKFRTVKSAQHFYGVEPPIADLQRAIRLVRTNAKKWNIDPERVGVFGFSAGGLIASNAATRFDLGKPQATDPVEQQSSRPDFAALAYPLISMKTKVAGQHYQELALGEKPTEARIYQFSSELHVDKNTPPVFLVHATDDTGVSVENTQRFAVACRQAGVPCTTFIRDEGGHGYGIRDTGKPINAWTTAFHQWLQENKLAD